MFHIFEVLECESCVVQETGNVGRESADISSLIHWTREKLQLEGTLGEALW
jgi:hypothetical protein